MNSTQQQCFMLSAEYMNFTKAAEKLYITQPALSRNISSLEEELELLLFVRKNNVLSITPGGQMLYDWMKKAEQDFTHVLESARLANSQPKQALHIGFVKSEMPPRAAAEALKNLRTSRPEMQLSIKHFRSRDIVEQLEEHTMDVALMIGSAVYGKPRLVSKKLATFRRCIAVSIGHPLAFREKVSLAELRQDVFISVVPENSPTYSQMIRRVCDTVGFAPKILEAEDTDQQIEWIESGRGVGLVVENHVERRNPLISFVSLEEDFPVDMVCAWDRLNTNPHIPGFIEAFGVTA